MVLVYPCHNDIKLYGLGKVVFSKKVSEFTRSYGRNNNPRDVWVWQNHGGDMQ